jgi:hypothetical protein
VQRDILEQHSNAEVKVYAVWLPVLGGDSRRGWDDEVMTDRRVTHLYDGERLVGSWFAQNVTLEDGFVWDTYLLYGPDATWSNVPTLLISSGGTIIDKGSELRDKLVPLLKFTAAS